MNKIRVTIWNEFRHEKMDEECNKIYPGGLHNVLKKYLEVNEDFEITLAALAVRAWALLQCTPHTPLSPLISLSVLPARSLGVRM